MGWSFRKSFRLLPGVAINWSKSGPRLSVGVPGIRASIGKNGKARVYGGLGPLRYQKTITIARHPEALEEREGLLAFVMRVFRNL